jgi:nucleotide-binding universal stress UspA family protein
MAWTKLLCAIDFSDSSREALDEAVALAERVGATLTILHVYPEPRPAMLSADMFAFPPEDLLAQALGEAERGLAPLVARAAAKLGEGRVDSRLLAGSPDVEIPRVAAGGKYDLVVIGTHGRTGVKRLVLGSVAEHVVRSAPVSVLVVRGAGA